MAPEMFTFPTDAERAGDLFGLTQQEIGKLQEAATKAKGAAYCPYSKFRVGAAVLSRAGGITRGANVENASYPVGTCAERVAFGTAVVEGVREFKAVAVATDITPPGSPCGMCRQFISEFCEKQTPIILFDGDNKFIVMRVEELLPNAFGPKSMDVQVEAQGGDSGRPAGNVLIF